MSSHVPLRYRRKSGSFVPISPLGGGKGGAARTSLQREENVVENFIFNKVGKGGRRPGDFDDAKRERKKGKRRQTGGKIGLKGEGLIHD